MSDIPVGELAVSVQNVSFSYGGNLSDGGIPVFQDLNFTLNAGQTVGLIGRNGSGKSTLLNIIRGRDVPAIGRVKVFSSIISEGGRLKKKPASVTLISQRPDAALCPTMTVYENYILSRHCGRLSFRWVFTRTERERCRTLLAQAGIGLEDKLHEQARFLSGGQQQALSVLLGLMAKSPVLLMDEPTASLDHLNAERILDLATERGRQNRGLVLIISHRLEELLPRCDSILVLSNGKALHKIRSESDWSVENFRKSLWAS